MKRRRAGCEGRTVRSERGKRRSDRSRTRRRVLQGQRYIGRRRRRRVRQVPRRDRSGAHRSEEHTSELQSLMRISYAVFCLKKKNNNTQTNTHTIEAKQYIKLSHTLTNLYVKKI